MSGFALGQERAVIYSTQFVAEVNHRIANVEQLGPDQNFFVIADWCAIAAFGLSHGDEASVLFFHIAIGKTQLPQQFDAPHLEPYKMVRVVDHAHLIGLRVAHAQPGFIDRLRVIGIHSLLQTGLRFSRNDDTPSRKSAVVRMRALSSMAAATCSSSCFAIKPLISFLVARPEAGLFSRS